ncbi:hypothetical protein [Streptomyces uncialis]|uniref:hypothetical protein n=1 Tax=Streptomyces uncialis TaxID=1048205 RepID=UPI00093C4B62|nr:hypothetical protein [Streptomyces uncialis]
MNDDLLDRLTRARLVDDVPCTREDIAAAEARIAVRGAGPCAPAPGAEAGSGPARDDRLVAAGQLTTLCETVVTHAALHGLRNFLTQTLPEPDGALLLGCLLQLKAGDEAARFWWQYAAGAGDQAAVYCLYLHHLSLGEDGPASWWYVQRPGARLTEPSAVGGPRGLLTGLPEGVLDLEAADASLTTTLRVLGALRTRDDWRVPAMVYAVMDYIPAAVDWVDDDVELPLPEPGFTDRIRSLTGEVPKPDALRVASGLPARPLTPRVAIAEAARGRCAR